MPRDLERVVSRSARLGFADPPPRRRRPVQACWKKRDRRHAFSHPAANEARANQQEVNSTAVESICKSAGESIQSCLCRTVDVVCSSHSNASDRAEHNDLTSALRSQQFRHNCEDIDLRHVVGVHDRNRMGGILFSQSLISQHSEGEHGDPDRPVLGDDLFQPGMVGGYVGGVELDAVHGARPSGCDPSYLLGQVLAAASREDNDPARCEALHCFQPNLAATAKQQNSSACDPSRPQSHSPSLSFSTVDRHSARRTGVEFSDGLTKGVATVQLTARPRSGTRPWSTHPAPLQDRLLGQALVPGSRHYLLTKYLHKEVGNSV